VPGAIRNVTRRDRELRLILTIAVLPLGNVTVVLFGEDVCDIGAMIADWPCMMQDDRFLKQSGAYVLSIELKDGFQGTVGNLGDIALPPGLYLYFGSARGPGGMAARLRRHVRSEKKPHWHVDWLTLAGQVVEFLAVPDGHECALCQRATALKNSMVPVTGFGSSDCPLCPAHLLSVLDEGSPLLWKLAEIMGGKIYSAASLLPTTAAHPSTV
jgi:Uri superfamily endonuclease